MRTCEAVDGLYGVLRCTKCLIGWRGRHFETVMTAAAVDMIYRWRMESCACYIAAVGICNSALSMSPVLASRSRSLAVAKAASVSASIEAINCVQVLQLFTRGFINLNRRGTHSFIVDNESQKFGRCHFQLFQSILENAQRW
jgi:hypothetical protein